MAAAMYLTHTDGRRMVRALGREGFKGGSFDLSRLNLVGFDWDVAICRDMVECEDRRVLLDRFVATTTVANNDRRSLQMAMLQMPDAQSALLGRLHLTVWDWPVAAREAYLLRGLFWQQAAVLGLDFEITDSPMFPRGPRGNKPVRRDSWALAGFGVAEA